MVGNILRRGGISAAAAAAATAVVGVVNFLSDILREYLFVYMYIHGLYTHRAYNNIIILFRVSSLSITPGASLFNRVAGIIIYAAVDVDDENVSSRRGNL